MGMSLLWESHGKRETSHGMGRDRHKLLWDGNGTDKYVPWTTLAVTTSLTGDALGFNGKQLTCEDKGVVVRVAPPVRSRQFHRMWFGDECCALWSSQRS